MANDLTQVAATGNVDAAASVLVVVRASTHRSW
jgi:hypothetical protein